jgi:chemotaxis protein CheD
MTSRTREFRRSSLEFQADLPTRIPVRIGDVKVTAEPSVLFTIGLGSCVAVAVYEEKRRIGGLAHAMLPHPRDGRSLAPPGRFAVTAVTELLSRMLARGASLEHVRARLVGGASMFRDVLEGEELRLGRRNVESARRALEEAGVAVEAEDVFGTHGRSVYMRTTDGRLLVTAVDHADVFL